MRNIWGPYNTSQPIEKVREANKILDDHGVKVSIEGTGFFKIPAARRTTPKDRRNSTRSGRLLDAAMERAKAFGTDKLRIFTFMLGKGETKNEKAYDRIWELTREAARRAKGFRLAVENIGGGYVSTGAEAAMLFKNVKEANIGLTWDPNNAGESGEQSFPDGYRKLDPARIFHVHLRDYKHQDGKVVWAKVGDGEFDNLGPDPRHVEGWVQGHVHAGNPLARPQGQDLLHRTEPGALTGSDRQSLVAAFYFLSATCSTL